jgi:hypothetical protein
MIENKYDNWEKWNNQVEICKKMEKVRNRGMGARLFSGSFLFILVKSLSHRW